MVTRWVSCRGETSEVAKVLIELSQLGNVFAPELTSDRKRENPQAQFQMGRRRLKDGRIIDQAFPSSLGKCRRYLNSHALPLKDLGFACQAIN